MSLSSWLGRAYLGQCVAWKSGGENSDEITCPLSSQIQAAESTAIHFGSANKFLQSYPNHRCRRLSLAIDNQLQGQAVLERHVANARGYCAPGNRCFQFVGRSLFSQVLHFDCQGKLRHTAHSARNWACRRFSLTARDRWHKGEHLGAIPLASGAASSAEASNLEMASNLIAMASNLGFKYRYVTDWANCAPASMEQRSARSEAPSKVKSLG